MADQYHLRALELEDLDTLFSIENNRTHWKFANRTHPYTRAFLMEYILQSHLRLQDIGQLRLAVANKSNKALGLVDLFDADLHHRRAAVGIAIHERYQQKGLGSSTLKLLLDYCQKHLSLHQLYCDIDADHAISIHLFETAGFELCGTKKDWNYYDQKFHTVNMYQKLL